MACSCSVVAWERLEQTFARPDYAKRGGGFGAGVAIHDDVAMEVGQLYRSTAVLGAGLTGPALADDYKSLPEGPGRDVMVRVCAQCHSPEVAAQQSLDAPGWKALVDQMANNGAQASDAEFDTITKYLTAAFPPK